MGVDEVHALAVGCSRAGGATRPEVEPRPPVQHRDTDALGAELLPQRPQLVEAGDRRAKVGRR